MRKYLSDALAFMAILAVIIGLLGTADAYETGMIGALQSFYQSAISVILAAAFGYGSRALGRRK